MRALLPIAVILLAGCVGAVDYDSAQRIDTPLTTREFNSLNSQYMERPTHVEHVQIVGGGEALMVTVDPYGDSKTYNESKLFMKEHVPTYITYIEKYLEWESEASEHEDILHKEIGTAKAQGGMPMKFHIYSGNARSHYLNIEHCTLGMCGEDGAEHFYDRENAEILKDLLLDFQSGDLKTAATGSYR